MVFLLLPFKPGPQRNTRTNMNMFYVRLQSGCKSKLGFLSLTCLPSVQRRPSRDFTCVGELPPKRRMYLPQWQAQRFRGMTRVCAKTNSPFSWGHNCYFRLLSNLGWRKRCAPTKPAATHVFWAWWVFPCKTRPPFGIVHRPF